MFRCSVFTIRCLESTLRGTIRDILQFYNEHISTAFAFIDLSSSCTFEILSTPVCFESETRAGETC